MQSVQNQVQFGDFISIFANFMKKGLNPQNCHKITGFTSNIALYNAQIQCHAQTAPCSWPERCGMADLKVHRWQSQVCLCVMLSYCISTHTDMESQSLCGIQYASSSLMPSIVLLLSQNWCINGCWLKESILKCQQTEQSQCLEACSLNGK